MPKENTYIQRILLLWQTKLDKPTLFFLLLMIGCIIQYIEVSRLHFIPLEIPLSLKGGDVYEADFNIDVKTEYVGYMLELIHNLSNEESFEQSRNSLTQMDVTWTIMHQDSKLYPPYDKKEVDAIWGGDRELRRILCNFHAIPGKYHIVFRLLKKPDSTLFKDPKLTLKISLHPTDCMGYVIKIQLAFLGIVVFGSLAFISFYSLYKERKLQEKEI